jgi:hypothetical protein
MVDLESVEAADVGEIAATAADVAVEAAAELTQEQVHALGAALSEADVDAANSARAPSTEIEQALDAAHRRIARLEHDLETVLAWARLMFGHKGP